MIKPIQGNILIEPIKEETAWSTASTQYEERGKVIEIADDLKELTGLTNSGTIIVKESLVKAGDIIYFDSWQAAKFKDGEGKDIWLVHIDAVRAVEKQDETT